MGEKQSTQCASAVLGSSLGFARCPEGQGTGAGALRNDTIGRP